ncbi:MAG: DUF6046 domain-containing protein [Bacteroidetes bacterium]|nr:DUF6046 domain-containing protein [Bacteroidota bacterium]
MAEIKFDINNAFREVFGVYSRVPLFPLAGSGSGVASGGGDFPDAAQLEKGDGLRLEQGMGGSVLIDRFAFGVQKLPSEGSGYWYNLSPYTILEITCAKNIVKTPLQGRNGTVKEFISMGDWQLHFKGFLINEEADELPYEQTAQLLKVFTKNTHLIFSSETVRRWFEGWENNTGGEGLDFLVVDDVKLPAMDGFENVQPFEIMAVSDNPVEIQLLMQNA